MKLSLAGLVLAAAASGCARQADSRGISDSCRVIALPGAVRPGDGVISISRSAHGRPWAVAGGNAAVLRWNGNRWAVIPRVEGSDTALALSPKNVWFAAGDANIWHWDGHHFSYLRYSVAGDVAHLAGTRTNSVWVMSYSDDNTYVAHWNGSRWSDIKAPPLGQNPADTVAARGKNVWIVGGWFPPAILAHWDGSRWHRESNKMFLRAGLNAVLDLGPRDVWGVGAKRTLHFDGTKWAWTPGPGFPGSNNGPVIAGLRHGPIYAAGGDGNDRALLLSWSGKRWVRVPTAPLKGSSEFDSLVVGANGDVWAGGETYRGAYTNHVRAFIEHCVPRARTRGTGQNAHGHGL